MNKIFSTLIIIIFANSILFSQNDISNSNFKIGLNIGPNYTSLRGGDFADAYDSKINYFAGVSLEYKISYKFSLLTNINYDSKYLKADYSETIPAPFSTEPNATIESITDNELRFKYINIPVFARYYLGSKNNHFINLGIFYNHLLNAKYDRNERQDGALAVLGYFNDDLTDFIKSSDYGITFGIGTNLKIKEKNLLTLELRNDFGIQEIQEDNFFGVKSIKTNTLRLILNWNFEL